MVLLVLVTTFILRFLELKVEVKKFLPDSTVLHPLVSLLTRAPLALQLSNSCWKMTGKRLKYKEGQRGGYGFNFTAADWERLGEGPEVPL